MKLILNMGVTALMLWVPLAGNAQTGSVLCTDKNGMSKYVVFDESKKTVLMDGAEMDTVSITKREIRFVQNLNERGKWPISIDRVAGTMTIYFPAPIAGMTSFTPLTCEKAQQKYMVSASVGWAGKPNIVYMS